MYEYGLRLGREMSGLKGLQRQAKCYLAALNALRLVDPKYAWIIQPGAPTRSGLSVSFINVYREDKHMYFWHSVLQDKALDIVGKSANLHSEVAIVAEWFPQICFFCQYFSSCPPFFFSEMIKFQITWRW